MTASIALGLENIVQDAYFSRGFDKKGDSVSEVYGRIIADVWDSSVIAPYVRLLETYKANLKQFYSTKGREFVTWLKDKGKSLLKIVGVSVENMPGAYAAVYTGNDEDAVFVMNTEFKEMAIGLARNILCTSEVAEEYILCHESAHLAGEWTEYGAEMTCFRYFSEKAAKDPKYKALAKYIADVRVPFAKKLDSLEGKVRNLAELKEMAKNGATPEEIEDAAEYLESAEQGQDINRSEDAEPENKNDEAESSGSPEAQDGESDAPGEGESSDE